ncbi:MAG: sulfatase [bacterium]|nr:sulfatase [bacterium]
MAARLLVFLLALAAAASELPNVLVIAIDDLRDELACYGADHIRSPNIDSLASRGLLFERAYCQLALCGPSRNSIFAGARPDTTGVHNNRRHFRQAMPDAVSMPELFKRNGYFTRGLGKVLHNNQDDPPSWSAPFFFVRTHLYARPENLGKTVGIDGIHAFNKQRPLVESAAVADNAYRDGMICDEAVTTLRRAAARSGPFFVMVGFHKPHTPFNAPKRYWDLHSPDEIDLAPNPFPPEGAPPYALSAWRYVRSFQGMPDSGPMPGHTARLVKHAYFACISYIDAQVGRLLGEIESLGVGGNTIVALWSDHGYQLGEHGMWSKHTNFETSTKVPFILADPRGGVRGARTDARVELIDQYPTLAELASLDLPDHLEGKSLAPLLKDPDAFDDRDTAAFSQFSRAGRKGFSVRTRRFRYTEWRNQKTGEVDARELYNHDEDPLENHNRAGEPEYSHTVERLSQRLDAIWTR